MPTTEAGPTAEAGPIAQAGPVTGAGQPASGNLLTDNPELYEARFPDVQGLAARWTEAMLRAHGAGPRVLDLGCGTGRDAARLHAAGRKVVGADLSAAMLAYARREHPGPDYVTADLRGFDLGRDAFDAITCLDSALLYCHTGEELDGLLTSCRRALAPGGLLVAEMRNGAFFLGNTELLDAPTHGAVSWQGTTYQFVTTLWVDRAAQLLRRRRVWTAEGLSHAAPPLEQHSAWRLLFPQELRHLLAAHGFTVRALHDGPGPRTEPVWHEDSPPPGDLADGDRLHLVAQLTAS
ncbi:class I SAM-dependent DNA methyltransferase [Streptomyces zagrosensis]|uniref:SAM-dependent methyltransferase n=1 Tax=Streptomyces zagrosensis TaxID=1042984 RepID=A0A7W9QDC6_9ACTN|nr:class I SAM-dependent methyltransferase [Streptomyces zagrosensis]MBB5937854.1 SAM-dependent methyltransferase [Streptomyces zagrosensis]